MYILDLFLILGEGIQFCIFLTIKHNISNRFFVDALYRVEKVPLCFYVPEFFFFPVINGC